MEIKKRITKNPFFLIISKPGIYIKSLIWNTLLIGGFTLLTGLLVKSFDITTTIPTSFHSLVGFVIGMLLVFRTNSAYDRWWDGRKIISSLSTEVGLITARFIVLQKSQEIMALYNTKNDDDGVLEHVKEFLNNLHNYLVNSDDDVESSEFHLSQNKIICKTLIELGNYDQSNTNVGHIQTSLSKILEYSNSLERIKNTPIPLAYVLHIKMSILIYLLTLPFGMFHEMGLWSVPLVMLVYYIIAGVEIISNEIENPFADDPNDLPTSQLFDDMFNALKVQ